MSHSTKIRLHDLSEIVVGASVLGFPLAVSGEVWELSRALPWISMIPIVAWSVFFLSAFIYYLHYHGNCTGKRGEFVARVLISYGLTLFCCAMTLALVNKLPMIDEPGIAMKRMLLVAFPACFAATVVDSMSQ